MNDYDYMGLALEQAQKAYALGEVPVGAVLVWEDRVVGMGYNRRETEKNALLHAEMGAIDLSCRILGGWRLHKATLYVTLEPCPMCAGAIINARIARVVYGARDSKAGCFGSVCDFNTLAFNHHPQIVGGVREQECSELLQAFFRDLRERRKRQDCFLEKTRNDCSCVTP